MNINDFNIIVEQRLDTTRNMLVSKGNEYNLEEDRLGSFKRAAILENCSPKEALGGYLAKHIISIYDMLSSNQKFTKARYSEKIGDSINYLILLEALLEDTNEFLEEK